MRKGRLWIVGLIAWIATSTALAEKKYDPGATDAEETDGVDPAYLHNAWKGKSNMQICKPDRVDRGSLKGIATLEGTFVDYWERVK